jgi:hypothetical protein
MVDTDGRGELLMAHFSSSGGYLLPCLIILSESTFPFQSSYMSISAVANGTKSGNKLLCLCTRRAASWVSNPAERLVWDSLG